MQKKGVVDLQFNWIIVTILGACLLLLFMIIAARQKNISQSSSDLSALSILASGLSASDSSSDYIQSIELPKSKVSFTCNSYSLGAASKSISNIILFSSSAIESTQVLLMSNSWDFPYKISNFVYLTEPSIRYIFVGDSEFAREIFNNFNINNKEGYTHAGAIPNNGKGKEMRIIFFGQDPAIPGSLKDSHAKITALKITGGENGMAEFFEFNNGRVESKGSSNYAGKAAMLGAIFSGSIERYNCAMEKAFESLNRISRVYQEKADILAAEYLNNERCLNFYKGSLQEISELLSVLASAKFSDMPNIIDAAEKIKRLNNLASAYSCALIY